MPNTPANRCTVFLKQWEKDKIAERESVIVTARCCFCDWTLEGTVADTRTSYRIHREEHHPEVKPRVRRKRMRPFGQVTGKSLDDNIVHARTQGAAVWATDE